MDIKNKFPKIVLYFFVGGVAALSDLLIFFVFTKLLGIYYVYIAVLGFIIATFINYLLSIRFVFDPGARFSKLFELGMVYLASLLAFAVHLAILILLIDYFSLEKMISKTFATIGAFMFNYLIRKYYVFAKKRIS